MICASCEKEAALFKTYICGHCGTEFASPAGDVGALVSEFEILINEVQLHGNTKLVSSIERARAELDKWR